MASIIEPNPVEPDLALRWFPGGDPLIPSLLLPKDLALASALLRERPRDQRRVAEVGVYKGWWSIGVIRNVDGAEIIGIDPFHGEWGAGIRAELGTNLNRDRAAHAFRLYASREAAEREISPGSLAMVHIDGEHTEGAATGDLDWAHRMLAGDGVIVMDDFRNAWWPGVGAALHGFIRRTDFRIFAVTERKAYLCRADSHEERLHYLGTRLSRQTELAWARHWGEGEVEASSQRPDVLGFPLLLVLGADDTLPSGNGAPWVAGWAARLRQRLAPIAADLLPPLVVRAMIHRGWINRPTV